MQACALRRFLALCCVASVVVLPCAQAQPKDAGKVAGKDAGKGGPAARPPMPVRAAAAKVAPAIEETNAVGNLRADEAIALKPEIAGRIAEIHFSEGQNVARGAKLVSLDSAELTAVLAGSTSDVAINRQRVARAEDLFAKGFISQQGLDDARSNLAKSVAKQAEDQAKLARTELRAPFPGVMGLRQVSQGAYVAAGTEIARLEKIDQLKLDFRVPETFLAKIRTGQKARVEVDAYRGEAFTATIYAIEPGIDEATRTVLARARVVNPALKLRPGMYARVIVQLGERPNAVWIPEQAIVPRGQDSFAFRIVEGKVELVKLQTGLRKVGEVEVVKGLAEGDKVVTDGVLRLAPGMAVSIMPEGGAKPAAAAGGPAPATGGPAPAKDGPAPAKGGPAATAPDKKG